MERFCRFLTTTTLLFAAPLPLFVCLTLKLGGLRAALEAPAGELLLALLYWLPIGVWLSFSKARFWTKLLLGYLLSLPLYFTALTILYPLWGGTMFHPFTHARLFIYISA